MKSILHPLLLPSHFSVSLPHTSSEFSSKKIWIYFPTDHPLLITFLSEDLNKRRKMGSIKIWNSPFSIFCIASPQSINLASHGSECSTHKHWLTWEISRDIDSKCNYNIFNQLISSTIIERVGHWKCFSINVERFKSRSQMLRLKTHMISRSMPHQYFVILSNFMIIIFNWVVIILILDNHS